MPNCLPEINLLLDATPDVTQPGLPDVLMLVGADGKSNFLVPGQVIEGFGSTDDKDSSARKGQAGIKGSPIGTHAF